MRNDTLHAKQGLQNDIANMLMEFEREHNVSVHEIDVYPMDVLEVYIHAPFRCRFYDQCNLKSAAARTCNRGGGSYCGKWREYRDKEAE